MKNVLLVLSTATTTTTPDGAIEFAVKTAKEHGATLHALYIVELDLKEDAFERFSDIGFIGDKPSTELSEALMKESRQRGYEEIGRAQVMAMEDAVPFEPLTVQGDYLPVVMDVVEEHEIDMVIAVRKKQSVIKKYFARSITSELSVSAPCEVVFFDDKTE